MQTRPALYHAGIPTFLGAPLGTVDELKQGTMAVLGIPYDYACGSRPGARWGPRAIRQSSLYFDYFLRSTPHRDFVDVGTRETVRVPNELNVLDLGDVELFPMDVHRTIDSIADATSRVAERGAIPVVLGGDHFVTYPAFLGVHRTLSGGSGSVAPKRLGYVHVDAHFDLFDDNPPWGKYYHGSTLRRIAELEGLDSGRMLVVGAQGWIDREMDNFLAEQLIDVVPLRRILQDGMSVVKDALEELMRRVDAVYVSVDIDVLSGAHAPGTGGITYEGFSPNQLFEVLSLIQTHPVAAIDLVEVAPNYDPSERTQRIAADVLLNFIIQKGAERS